MRLEIKLGKKYVCRDEPEIKYASPLLTMPGGGFECEIVYSDLSVSYGMWQSSGQYPHSDTTKHKWDLVAEYVEPGEMGQVAYFGYIDEPGHVWKCECGAEKVGHKTHSTWCVKHED